MEKTWGLSDSTVAWSEAPLEERVGVVLTSAGSWGQGHDIFIAGEASFVLPDPGAHSPAPRVTSQRGPAVQPGASGLGACTEWAGGSKSERQTIIASGPANSWDPAHSPDPAPAGPRVCKITRAAHLAQSPAHQFPVWGLRGMASEEALPEDL